MSALSDKLEQIRGGKIINIQSEQVCTQGKASITESGSMVGGCEELWMHVELPSGEVVGLRLLADDMEGSGYPVISTEIGWLDNEEGAE